jgi:hypothetical protein
VLILSCALGLNLYLLDFLGAFLHSLMPDRFPVYIKTPPGLDVPDGFMVRLHKSLYGTRNAGHLWWNDLRKALLDLGYKQCPFDQCLFYRMDSNGTITSLGDLKIQLLVVVLGRDLLELLVPCCQLLLVRRTGGRGCRSCLLPRPTHGGWRGHLCMVWRVLL